MSSAEARGPQLLQGIVSLVQTAPAVLGYTVALATIAPALLAIGLAGLLPSP